MRRDGQAGARAAAVAHEAGLIVNHWVPAAHKGDAIGDSARRLRDFARELGHDSELYALTIDGELVGDVRPFDPSRSMNGDVTLFHFGLSSAMTDLFRSLPRGRVLLYHNITPARFFAPHHPHIFRLAALGRRELRSLAGDVDLALAVSEYNRTELVELGFARTGVLPLAVDLDRITRAGRRPALEALLSDHLMNFLFVGRLTPNKRIEDHLRLAEHYKRYVDADYRFIFVGRTDAVPRYYAAIRQLISDYRMLPERFVFTGAVSDEELSAYYRTARVYVSLSEHEGFCAPLIEAMAADVPVLAYSAAAVPETLAGAGVQFAPKDLAVAAELLGALAFDERLRTAVLAGQRLRLTDFSGDRQKRDLASVLAQFEGDESGVPP